eukprot:gene4322-biopygen9939
MLVMLVRQKKLTKQQILMGPSRGTPWGSKASWDPAEGPHGAAKPHGTQPRDPMGDSAARVGEVEQGGGCCCG